MEYEHAVIINYISKMLCFFERVVLNLIGQI